LAQETEVRCFEVDTREPEMRPAGVSFKYTADGPESNPRLQFDRFNFSDESLVVVG
jgi:hypothetical protein